MLLKTRKRLLRPMAATSAGDHPGRVEKSRLEIQTELFTMAVVAGDLNLIAAAARLRSMTASERRDLRLSIERLDSLLDEVDLELHLARDRNGGKLPHA